MNISIEQAYAEYQKYLAQKTKLSQDYQNAVLTKEQYELDDKNVEKSIRELYKNSLKAAYEYLKTHVGIELSIYHSGNNYNSQQQVISSLVKKNKTEFTKDVEKTEGIIKNKFKSMQFNQAKYDLLVFAVLAIKEYYLADLEDTHNSIPSIKPQETYTPPQKTFQDFLSKSMGLFTLYIIVTLCLVGWSIYPMIKTINPLNISTVLTSGILPEIIKQLPQLIWDAILTTNFGILNNLSDLTTHFGVASFFALAAIFLLVFVYLIIPIIYIFAKYIIKVNNQPTFFKKLFMAYIAIGSATLLCSILFYAYTLFLLPEMVPLLKRLALMLHLTQFPDVLMFTNILMGLLLVIKLISTFNLYKKYLKDYFDHEDTKTSKK